MLRRISWIPIVLLCAGLTTPTVAEPTLALVNVPATLCDVQVAIRLTDPDSAYTSFVVTVDYDNTKLTFVDAELGPAAIAAGYNPIDLDSQVSAATMQFPISSGMPFNRHVQVLLIDQSQPPFATITGTDQDVIYLNFNALAPNTSTALALDDSAPVSRRPTYLTREDLDDITAGGINFPLTNLDVIVEALTLSGCALYAISGLPINGVDVIANQGSTMGSDETGNSMVACEYEITGFGNGAVTISAARTTDLDDEEVVSGGDANRMWQFAASMPVPSANEIRIGDVVSPFDQMITPLDAVAVSKWLIRLEDAPNKTGDWSFDLDDGTNPPGRETLMTAFVDCTDLTVDLTGYFLGDVNFSWPLRNSKPLTAPIGFALETIRHDAELLEVRMSADVSSQALENLVYSLHYDAGQWTFAGTSLDSRIASFMAMDNPTQAGVVHGLVLGVDKRMAESGPIATFTFHARVPNASGRFEFSRLVANDQKSTAMPVLDLGRTPATAAPRTFALASAPNPFNPTSRIEYRVADEAGTGPVTLRVYDLAGHLVRTLVEATQSPGIYQSTWNGRDDAGRMVGTGVYLIQMRAGAWTQVHKTALVK